MQLFPETLQADRGFTAAEVEVPEYMNGEGMDPVEAGAVFNIRLPNNSPAIVPTILWVVGGEWQYMPGMLTDYYNQIHVIPDVLTVRNPTIGQEQPFYVWNAYLHLNTLTTINGTDDTGLVITPTVGAGLDFNALEMKDFFITVTAAAPVTIDAFFEFIFEEGSDTFIFRADRATIMPYRPDAPSTQTFEWSTEILKTWDGGEQRISTRPRPRQKLEYNILLESDTQLRWTRANLFGSLKTPLCLPLWHEEFNTTTAAVIGNTSLNVDLTLTDIVDEDFMFLEHPSGDYGELVRVTAHTDSTATLNNPISHDYPLGSFLYPVAFAQMPEGQSFGRRPVNVGTIRLQVDGIDHRILGGSTATVPTYDSLPLLDRRPLNPSENQETFELNSERFDYGATFSVKSFQERAEITQQRSYLITTREEFQFWKKLLDTLVGMREPFLCPTYREDLLLSSQPAQGGASIDVLKEEGWDYLTQWFPSDAHRYLVLTNDEGDRLYRYVEDCIDNGDGTLSISFADALPNTVAGSTITKIEFLEKVRLGSDRVVFKHHGTHSTVEIAVRTINA